MCVRMCVCCVDAAVLVFLQAVVALAIPGSLASVPLPTVASGAGAAALHAQLSKGVAAFKRAKGGSADALPGLDTAGVLELEGAAKATPDHCAAVVASAYVPATARAAASPRPPNRHCVWRRRALPPPRVNGCVWRLAVECPAATPRLACRSCVFAAGSHRLPPPSLPSPLPPHVWWASFRFPPPSHQVQAACRVRAHPDLLRWPAGAGGACGGSPSAHHPSGHRRSKGRRRRQGHPSHSCQGQGGRREGQGPRGCSRRCCCCCCGGGSGGVGGLGTRVAGGQHGVSRGGAEGGEGGRG